MGARFRLNSSDAEAVGDWSWADNDFLGTQPYHGLIVANILLNNWDWKTSNNKIYHFKSGVSPRQRYVVRDLGASLGKTSHPACCGFFHSGPRIRAGLAK